MKNRKWIIDTIPAVLYGEDSEKCFLYIHGKLGFKEEAESFAEIACTKGWQALSVDLPEPGLPCRALTVQNLNGVYLSRLFWTWRG